MKVLIDSHVHLHPSFDIGATLDQALLNLEQGAQQAGVERWTGALLLTEAGDADRFRELRAGRTLQGYSDRWALELGADGTSVLARSGSGPSITIIAGRQLRVEHRLEVLALCTSARIPEGQSLTTTLSRIREAGGAPVVPWGFGKWWGSRGRLLEGVIRSASPASFLLGDSGQRPKGFQRPPLLAFAERHGIGTIAGTDPFPSHSQHRLVGRYGSILTIPNLDLDNPAPSIRDHLLTLTDIPPLFGRRESLAGAVRNQIHLRLSRLRAGPGARKGS